MRPRWEYESGDLVDGSPSLLDSGDKHSDLIARAAALGAVGTVEGTAADDVLGGGPGFDFISGGNGTDTLDYSSATRSVAVALGLPWGGWALGEDIGVDWLAGMENVVGGAGDDVLVGNGEANVLVGNAGDDRIDGRSGDDLLTGGAGADTFVVGKRLGHDTVTDFEADGTDVVEVSSIAFADFAAISAAMQQVGDDTVITLDADNSITLQGTRREDLDASDFDLVGGSFGGPWQGQALPAPTDLPYFAWWRSASEHVAAAAEAASPDTTEAMSDPETPDCVLPAPAPSAAVADGGGTGQLDVSVDAESDALLSAIFQNTGFELFLGAAELELHVLRVEMLRAAGYDLPF